tara:strand:+ start:649 stop:969 length:321 start_codon:yes stop_codon:yes gene_type:complete
MPLIQPHKGLNQYSGSEASNASLGQAGFKILTAPGNTGDGHFVAFKVLGGASTVNVDITAVCALGDNLTITNVLTGEMVFGPFLKITIANVGTGIQVLCYKGRSYQ